MDTINFGSSILCAFRCLGFQSLLSAKRDYPKNPNDGVNCAAGIEIEFSAFRDSAAGKFRVTPTYDYIQLVRVNGRSVFEFEHFRLFSVHAREVCPEGTLTAFNYDTWLWLSVEIKGLTCLDIHSVSFFSCEYR
jgi:hypothetical protein